MSKRPLNKKSLLQMGGTTEQARPVDPALLEVVDHIKGRLEAGEKPQAIVMSLMQQNVPQEAISSAFEQVGYDPAAMVSLMQSIVAQQTQAQQQKMRSPEMGTDPAQEQQEQMQYGGTSKGPFYSKASPNLPRPNYLPILPERGDIFNAAAVLDDSIGSLFSGEQGSDGLMSGALRDLKAKKARWREAAPEYSKYKIDIDPNDPNTYTADTKDLHKGKLRTKEQYSKDILENSRLDFDTKTGKYKGYVSPDKIDPKLLGKKQVEPFSEFQKKSVSLKDFMNRTDSDTRELLAGTTNYPEGTTLGISPDGQASSYRDVEDNPYLYNTMMGLNPYKNEPVKDSKPFSIYEYGMNPNVQAMIPTKKHGGLVKAQSGQETGQPLSFEEWAGMNNRGNPGSEQMDQMDYERYKSSFVFAPDPKRSKYSGSGMGAIEQIDFGNESLNGLYQPDISNQPKTYKDPTITQNQNFASWANQQLDRPGVNAFGKVATAGVSMANVANEMFKEKRFGEYDDKLRKATMADKMFTTKNPVNSRGMWDVNTGLAEPDNYVPYLPAAQYGGDQGMEGQEIDIDNDTLMKLIAAGADIQIL